METSPLDVSLMFAVACVIFGAFCEMAAPAALQFVRA
jgi:hypothetical protein